jgi:pyrroline-5-carboxylate reductase
MSTLAVIGVGNMGRAILSGAVRAGVLSPGDAVVFDADADRCAGMARDGFGVATSGADAAARLGPGGQVLLAVKPQMLGAVSGEMAGVLAGSDRVVISILAGVPSDVVRRALGGWVRVVRAMPNLPSAVGQGATAVCLGAGARAGDDGLALALFRGIGPVVAAIGEDLMDAYTGVAGSGPAYVFLLAEAMLAGARGVGLDEATARAAVVQTIVGAAAMLKADPRSPGELRAAVTSRGGTTQAALEELARAGVVEAWVRAIAAARDRGRELGRMAGG